MWFTQKDFQRKKKMQKWDKDLTICFVQCWLFAYLCGYSGLHGCKETCSTLRICMGMDVCLGVYSCTLSRESFNVTKSSSVCPVLLPNLKVTPLSRILFLYGVIASSQVYVPYIFLFHICDCWISFLWQEGGAKYYIQHGQQTHQHQSHTNVHLSSVFVCVCVFVFVCACVCVVGEAV